MKRVLSRIVLTTTILSAQVSVFADGFTARCEDDKLETAEKGKGRNAWARKCNYLTGDEEGFANRKGLYVVFKDRSNIPTDENAACILGLQTIAFCNVGCYHADEGLLFADGEIGRASCRERV